MGISDKIEAFIMELMKNEAEYAEFGRNELADIFGCVPSQINYVISTRFSPEKGYTVESRRGGGGYIKIRRISLGGPSKVISQIGDSCDADTAKSVINYLYERGEIERQAAMVLLSAVSDKSLAMVGNGRNRLRAEILKNAICEL
ncbi:MAG: CtsR family transcriptional regulator [Clostridia bacterium]|nr:CtsR family transcriptional regulator [Clostridia bacterium]